MYIIVFFFLFLLTLDSCNRDTTEEKADDETVEEGELEGELEGEGNCKETQKKSKSRRKPKGKKHQPEEGKTLILEPKANPQLPQAFMPQKHGHFNPEGQKFGGRK